MGYLMGPAINYFMIVHPQILIQAVSYTAIMFGSFSAIAMFSKRRSYLFLGGVISTISASLFWYSMMTWFFAQSLSLDYLTYMMIGLFTACCYVIFDT